MFACLGAGLWATPSQVHAQNQDYLDQLPPLIDRDLFFGDPEIASAQVSPDGQYVTFRKPYQDVMNIWVKGIDEPFDAAQPITADTTRPVSGYFWSQDSRYVLYVQDKGGNENFHVYVVDPTAEVDPATGVPPARNVTDYEDTRAYIYAVPETTPGEILVGLNDRDPQWHDVYRVDLETGERTLLFQNEENLSGFQFDLAGDLRLATRTTEDGGTEVLRVDGDSLITIYTCTVEETCYPVRFHKDGEQVYMVTNKGDRDLTALVLFDPETQEETFIEDDPEGQVDFGGAEFSDVTDELVATYYLGDRLRIYPKDEQIEQDLAFLRSELPEGEIYFGSSTEDETTHIISVQRDVDPGSTYLYDRSGPSVELLYRSRPELPSEHLAPMQVIRYEARDGTEIPAYLTVPKGVEAENLPVVMNIHGGPWARDTWGYDSFAQFLANRGYAVLQPNFRGSTGYGKDFLNAGNKEWGTGLMQHDITDGVQYLIDEGIADPDRVAIMGGSYGGYATLAGLTFTPDVYAAGVSIVGPSNLITLLNTIPPYWAAAKKVFNERVGDPDDPEDREQLTAQSPFFHADRIDDPLLVIQGANDPRVKQAESDQIVVAARENDADVAYMVAPDEGHGFRGEENRLAMIAEIERFLAEHVDGRYQEEMSDELGDHLASLMVDVDTVTLPEAPEGAEEAATADLPAADGSVVTPGTMQYSTSLSVQGQELTIDATRTVAAHDGMLHIIDQATTPMGTAVDTFVVDAETLLPQRRSSKQGPTVIALDYSEGQITGSMSNPMGEAQIDKSLDAPVVGESGALDVYLSALPLEEGYTTTLRTFSLQQQQVRPMRVAVTGTETVEVPAGTFETYVVEVTPLDGNEAGTSTMYLTVDAPHMVAKSTSKLPAQMGGGMATTTLTAMETGGSN
jgi:dipeptidyl aminopeptidase/acylaminoacyl peptidase